MHVHRFVVHLKSAQPCQQVTCPQVMVAAAEVQLNALFVQFSKTAEHLEVSGKVHMAVFKPEIKKITKTDNAIHFPRVYTPEERKKKRI